MNRVPTWDGRARRILTILVVALFAPWAALLAPGAAHAVVDDAPEGPTTWALAPATIDGPDGRGRFEYIVEPGYVYEDSVAVRNLGEDELTLQIYAQDALATEDSPFEVLTPLDVATRVGDWIRLPTDTVTVPARSHVVLPVTLVIPDDAEPGDHAGAILASLAPGENDEETSGAEIHYRTGTRFYVRVAGPVTPGIGMDNLNGTYHGRWGPFSAGTLDATTTLVNRGNVRLEAEPVVTTSSLFGLWSRSTPLSELEEILPGGAITTATSIESVPPHGPIWVGVDFPTILSRDQDVTSIVTVDSVTQIVWALPWTLLVALALLALAAVVAVRNLRERRRLRRAEGETSSTNSPS